MTVDTSGVPPAYTVTDADRALIAEAGRAFATDFVYLERILWGARKQQEYAAHPPAGNRKGRPKSAKVVMEETLMALEPRLALYVSLVPSGCWVWNGSLSGSGQPVIRLGPRHRLAQVRRALYEVEHGAIPVNRQARSGVGCVLLCVHPGHTFVLVGAKSRRALERQTK